MRKRSMKMHGAGLALAVFAGAQVCVGPRAEAQKSTAQITPAPAQSQNTPRNESRPQTPPKTPPQAPAAGTPAQTTSVSAAFSGGSIHGTVTSGTGKAAVGLPGVAVTATNTLTGKKYATTTDIDGVYAMTIPRIGRYVVRAELAAFAPVTSEVRITAEAANQVAEFGLQLASRAEQEQAAASAAVTRSIAGAAGTLGLDLTGGEDSQAADATAGGSGNTGASLPSLGGLAESSGDATESVAVAGQTGSTNGLAGISEDDLRDRIRNAMEQRGGAQGDQIQAAADMIGGLMGGGGFGGRGGGGGRGGRGGGGGGGGFRGFNPAQPHGAVFYVGSYGALNAAPFAISGVPVVNPPNNQNSFGLSFVGSPYIPGLVAANPKQFVFFNVTGVRNINPEVLDATVPTVAERAGDFSQLVQNVTSSSGVTTQQQVPIYDPTTGQQFAGCQPNLAGGACTPGVANVIPTGRISTQALALLNYYPAPNLAVPTAQGNNYQTITTAGLNRTNASLRFVRNLGQSTGFGFGGRGGGGGRNQSPAARQALRQNININASYSHSASDNRNVFLPLGGATESTGYALTAGYSIGRGRFTNNASETWNRSHAMGRNFFSLGNLPAPVDGNDPALPTLAANGFYGVPNLTFSGFTGLSQTVPSDSVNQTISFSDFVSYNHKRHNMRFGVDIRRVHADSLGGTNIFGNYTFTGYATENPQATACIPSASVTCPIQPPSGAGFADFLLGLPQQTTIQAGLAKTYLRANVFDWYAQDDWRMRPGLTLNYGLRYEYFGPYHEKNNRLVNLDHNADFTAVDPVLPGQTGTYGGKYNSALVNPDYTLYSPRVGFAYRPDVLPKITRQMVVRGGYGINFNTSQPASFARQLAFQPPFAVTQTNIVGQQGCVAPTTGGATSANVLTLAHGFGCSTSVTQNNYSVNKDYRLGHVQVWNLGIQRTFPLGIVANLDYNGSKGGDLDIVRAPNRTATGLLDPTVQAFNFEDSLGFSRLNLLALNVRKRLQKGVSIQATYQYGHSIDNASSIGGTSTVVAQNDLDLNAEEGNSSFLTRHQLSGNWVIELPFGPNRAFLSGGGVWSKVLDGFSYSGTYTFASGQYFTPNYLATVTETATGANNSRRPNRNFAVPITGPGRLRDWFNTAAFTDPGSGFGNASRGSIEGPGTVSVNSSLSRTFQLGSTRSFEGRLTAANTFNTVQYTGINTTLNSPTFGQVTGAAARRSLTFTGRYRF